MTSIDAGAPGGGDGREGSPSLKEMTANAVDTVKAEVATFAAATQERTADTVEAKKQAATRTMTKLARAIRAAGDELADSDESIAGRIVKQAADGLEDVTRSIADKRPQDLLDAARDFGRRNPVALIAVGVLLGVALARFAKSSENREREPEDVTVQVPSADFSPKPFEERYADARALAVETARDLEA